MYLSICWKAPTKIQTGEHVAYDKWEKPIVQMSSWELRAYRFFLKEVISKAKKSIKVLKKDLHSPEPRRVYLQIEKEIEDLLSFYELESERLIKSRFNGKYYRRAILSLLPVKKWRHNYQEHTAEVKSEMRFLLEEDLKDELKK